jgi:hypothetical protein
MKAVQAPTFVTLLLAVTLICAVGTTVQAYDWTLYNGHWYSLTHFDNWETCMWEAWEAGGYLTTINDAAENAFISAFTANCYPRNVVHTPSEN